MQILKAAHHVEHVTSVGAGQNSYSGTRQMPISKMGRNSRFRKWVEIADFENRTEELILKTGQNSQLFIYTSEACIY